LKIFPSFGNKHLEIRIRYLSVFSRRDFKARDILVKKQHLIIPFREKYLPLLNDGEETEEWDLWMMSL